MNLDEICVIKNLPFNSENSSVSKNIHFSGGSTDISEAIMVIQDDVIRFAKKGLLRNASEYYKSSFILANKNLILQGTYEIE